ncbi:FxsA family protein [Pelagibacterales bacterium SAG-MED05]|nr:FxsA family protein [Pelagibacterales bacterium SAG-MED05]
MNSFFLLFIGVPALEIFLMIKIGGKIGALNTVSLIFLTAVIGLYFAKLEGIKTMRSGVMNIYQNKVPIYEMITGASIALAALFLIIPGFFTDTIGFLLLIPFTRKILISSFIKKDATSKNEKDINTLDGEIIEDKNKKDEL